MGATSFRPLPRIRSRRVAAWLAALLVAGIQAVAHAAPAPAQALPNVFLTTLVGGELYAHLEALDQGRPLPEHGRPAHARDAGLWIAPLAPAAAPRWRPLLGSAVIADNGCRATVTGLWLISRLEASGDDLDGQPLDGDAIRDHGARAVVAKLDGCVVSDDVLADEDTLIAYVRRAGVGRVAPRELSRPDLVARATERLLTSELGEQAERSWREQEQTGSWRAEVAVRARVVVHPKTQTPWVIVQAESQQWCSTWSLRAIAQYRVERDGSLTQVELFAGPHSGSLARVVDLDHDGRFELVLHSWGTDATLLRNDGEILAQSSVGFIGCAC